jgi:hypothetical protein
MADIQFKVDTKAFKESLGKVAENFSEAVETTKNMIASMLREEITADIQGAGKFGAQYLSGLKVEVTDEGITTTLDAPGAEIFETGGTIHGNPLLWLPISGTDAEGTQASDYADQLFSVTRRSGVPLLFSVRDRAPKYFGVPSVNIPKKFHIGEIQSIVMSNFQAVFNEALKDANG